MDPKEGVAAKSKVNAQLICGLTMGVNVPQFIVHVEETPEALLSRGYWPVPRQDIFVELKVRRGLCKVQQARSFVKHHHYFLQPMPLHLVDSGSSSPAYILKEATDWTTTSGKLWSSKPIIGQV